MFILECLHEHVPVFLDLVRQRNSGLLEQLTITHHEYHSEVTWNVPDDLSECVRGPQGIDMHDILVSMRYTKRVYSLRVRSIDFSRDSTFSAYVSDRAKYLEQDLSPKDYGGDHAKNLPLFNWEEQQELHRIKLLLDITG